MKKFGYAQGGEISDGLEKRVAELAARYNVRFVVRRRHWSECWFEVDADEEERLPDGEAVVVAAIKKDAALCDELRRHTELFIDEAEIEF